MAARLAVRLDARYPDDQIDGGWGHHSRTEVRSHYPSWQRDTHFHPDQMGYSTDMVAEAERRASASLVGALPVSAFGLEEDHNQSQLDEYERE